MKRVRPLEAILVCIWAAAVMAVTAIPYHIARQEAGPDRVFTGFIWGVDDGNSYLAWIRQASEGRILLRNQYTIEPQNPHFFNVLLFLLGRAAAVSGLSPLTVLAIARYLLGFFALIAFYVLMAEVTSRRWVRGIALALASLSSGLGWLVVLYGGSDGRMFGLTLHPMDVAAGWQSQPEAIVFTSVLLNPLFSASLGLLSLIVVQVIRLGDSGRWRPAVIAGVLLLILGNMHGYDIVVMHGLIVLWLLCNVVAGRREFWRAAGQYAVIVAISAASVVWAYITVHSDPSYAEKVSTPTLTGRPFDVALGYGLVLALAIVGAWIALNRPEGARRRLNRGLLIGAIVVGAGGLVGQWLGVPDKVLGSLAFFVPLLGVVAMMAHRTVTARQPGFAVFVLWAACGAAVIYLPVSFQRKMIEGLHLPLCGLAALALADLAEGRWRIWREVALSRSTAAALAVAIVLLTIPSNVLFVGICLRNVRTNNREHLNVLLPPVYLSNAEVDAMEQLGARTTRRDIVLCSNLTGSHIPPRAPCKVVVGHWAETLGFRQYLAVVLRFYDPFTAPEVRRRILEATGADYVWWGPQERLVMGDTASARQARWRDTPGLRRVYANGEVEIFAYDRALVGTHD